jgi:hypothetical protein
VGAGLIGPGTIFGILACFFKPLLRKLLLKYKFTKLADCIVPDVEGDVSNIREDMNVVKVFMARQRSRLPPLKDQTPEMSVGDVAIDDASVAPLGRGGFGVVYRGKLHQTTVVAIKTIFGQGPFHAVVPADIRKMMLREAKIMCNLNHPNVLQIFGVVPEKGWIVMELCNGGALSELLLAGFEGTPVASGFFGRFAASGTRPASPTTRDARAGLARCADVSTMRHPPVAHLPSHAAAAATD